MLFLWNIAVFFDLFFGVRKQSIKEIIYFPVQFLGKYTSCLHTTSINLVETQCPFNSSCKMTSTEWIIMTCYFYSGALALTKSSGEKKCIYPVTNLQLQKLQIFRYYQSKPIHLSFWLKWCFLFLLIRKERFCPNEASPITKKYQSACCTSLIFA